MGSQALPTDKIFGALRAKGRGVRDEADVICGVAHVAQLPPEVRTGGRQTRQQTAAPRNKARTEGGGGVNEMDGSVNTSLLSRSCGPTDKCSLNCSPLIGLREEPPVIFVPPPRDAGFGVHKHELGSQQTHPNFIFLFSLVRN